MRALSVIQPWAWLLTAGPKRIENRPRHLQRTMDGQATVGQVVLIHASKTDPRAYAVDAAAFLRSSRLHGSVQFPPAYDRGGIVGWARLAGCLCPGTNPPDQPGLDLRWWMREQHGYLLSEVGVLPFVECKGALGFWRVPAEVLAQIPAGAVPGLEVSRAP